MKIIFAITGSIAAYKAYDTVRDLVKKGHEVRVILTKGALQFIKSETFLYLGATKVYSPEDDFKPAQTGAQVLHIELKNWCDIIVIYPLSANTMAKIAHGFAEDLLQSILLANRKPVMLFPAMNTAMYNHPRTVKNRLMLDEMDNYFIHPTMSGVLACGEEGEGKVCLPEEASLLIETWTPNKQKGDVLITTGATKAPIDPVRYLTNPASGKTGFLLAKEFLKLGHGTHIIAGESSAGLFSNFLNHPQFKMTVVKTTEQMREAALREFAWVKTYISAAALCDLSFPTNPAKLKKDKLSGTLKYTEAPDVLAEILAQKNERQKVVGFAAETNLTDAKLLKKWKSKPVDLLIGNNVDNGIESNENVGFGSDSGSYWFFEKGKTVKQEAMSKEQLAKEISSWTLA